MFIVYTELLLIYSTSEFIFYYLLYICYSLVLMSHFVFFNWGPYSKPLCVTSTSSLKIYFNFAFFVSCGGFQAIFELFYFNRCIEFGEDWYSRAQSLINYYSETNERLLTSQRFAHAKSETPYFLVLSLKLFVFLFGYPLNTESEHWNHEKLLCTQEIKSCTMSRLIAP